MKLVLGQTTEAVVPMATEGVVATVVVVVVVVVDQGEEDSEDIKLSVAIYTIHPVFSVWRLLHQVSGSPKPSRGTANCR